MGQTWQTTQLTTRKFLSKMDGAREYYTVFWDDCRGTTYDTLVAAIEDIVTSLRYEVTDDGAKLDNETGNYKIKTELMTPAMFAALPEFEGY